MRTFFIWFFGIMAGALIGSMIGSHLQVMDGGFWGFLAGMATFSCLRLWLSPRQAA